jgi:hypothetical protein
MAVDIDGSTYRSHLINRRASVEGAVEDCAIFLKEAISVICPRNIDRDHVAPSGLFDVKERQLFVLLREHLNAKEVAAITRSANIRRKFPVADCWTCCADGATYRRAEQLVP